MIPHGSFQIGVIHAFAQHVEQVKLLVFSAPRGADAEVTNNINPATNKPYPTVDSNFGPNYDDATTILLGIFAEGDGIYNFSRNGSALAQGTPINRRFAINDYEFYGQDTGG